MESIAGTKIMFFFLTTGACILLTDISISVTMHSFKSFQPSTISVLPPWGQLSTAYMEATLHPRWHLVFFIDAIASKCSGSGPC